MKTYTKEIVVYELEGRFDGFCVEVHGNEDATSLYLYHKQYGIKMHMIGVNSNEREIEELIDGLIEDYVETYNNCFMDEQIA